MSAEVREAENLLMDAKAKIGAMIKAPMITKAAYIEPLTADLIKCLDNLIIAIGTIEDKTNGEN